MQEIFLKKNTGLVFVIAFLLWAESGLCRKTVDFPKRTDPLHVRVDRFDKIVRLEHWNEGIILPTVIFPPAGLERPVIGGHADALDETGHLLVGYSYKYAVTKDPADREAANQLFDGILRLEKVTGIPGMVARSYYKSDVPLWHEQTQWYPLEWHGSTAMPGYRWMGDLSADKFTSLFYSLGIFWELCADQGYKQKAADFLDRFLGRIIDHNFKLIDLDNKMTLWGNFCPDLPHQPLNSLMMLMGLKVTHHLTGKERYRQAYRMLIDRHHYDDHQLESKVIWPVEWRNRWDDNHAAKSLYMLLRYEDDPTLLIKYRMNLNRHWHVWQTHDFSFECDALYVMLYQVLSGEKVLTKERIQGIKNLWGFNRWEAEFKIPTKSGVTLVKSMEQRSTCTLIQSYWFGRYYGLIDPSW
jgi:hypothetical protein